MIYFFATDGLRSFLKTWGISSDAHSPLAHDAAAAAFRLCFVLG